MFDYHSNCLIDGAEAVMFPERLNAPQAVIAQEGRVDCIWGDVRALPSLDALDSLKSSHLMVIPFGLVNTVGRPISSIEREQHLPLSVIDIKHEQRISLDRFLEYASDQPSHLTAKDIRFEPDDLQYEKLVAEIIAEEISDGRGSNFVVPRVLRGVIADDSPWRFFSLFTRLLKRESSSYMTYWCKLGTSVLVGASPEMHIRLDPSGTVTMNPISGTFHPRFGDENQSALVTFLEDSKERDELHMVVDEELKLLSRICAVSPSVDGPYLKNLAQLMHTEYYVRGITDAHPARVLRESLFAPTVLGGPLDSAFRVAAERDVAPRRYYGGVFGRLDFLDHGPVLDTAIMIRTFEVLESGEFRFPVGATIVRESIPANETRETVIKSLNALSALTDSEEGDPIGGDVARSLRERRESTSKFWLSGDNASAQTPQCGSPPRSAVLVDFGDRFVYMLSQILRSLGFEVRVVPPTELEAARCADLVVLGPGPGDPLDPEDARIGLARAFGEAAVTGKFKRVLAVCLSHQMICAALGIRVRRLGRPYQGVQRAVEVWGEQRRLGFYNSYAGFLGADERLPAPWQASVAGDSREIVAIRRAGVESVQFHPESMLSADGVAELCASLSRLYDEREQKN